VRDRIAATTTLASRRPGATGAGGNGSAFDATISADGNLVAFSSDATDLATDDGPFRGIFLRDLVAARTALVSRASGAAGAGGDGVSERPGLSADGRFATFESAASNFSDDDDVFQDVFLRDVLGPSAVAAPAVLPTALPPSAPPPGATPPVVTASSISGRYTSRVLVARLRLKGTASAPGRFVVRLTRVSGPRVSGFATAARLTFVVRKAGPVSPNLSLPKRLAPGRYRVSVGGVSVAGKAGLVTIARPAAGLLTRAFGSAAANGPAAVSFPSGRRVIYGNFVFGLVPTRGPVTTEWTGPDGATSGRVGRPRVRSVAGFVRRSGQAPLPPGRYTCTLRVAGKAIATVTLRIR